MRLAWIVVGVLSALLLGRRALADATWPSEQDACMDCDADGETNADAVAGDAGADAPERVGDRDGPAPVEHDGELPIDDEPARSALDAGAVLVEASLAASSGLVEASSIHDLGARRHRPSRWGRLDLALVWRRIDRDREPGEPSRRHEVLLVATWRN